MNNKTLKPHLGIVLVIGSIWGLTEFAFGLGLQKCATLYTGAILTGLAFFWLSFIWSITRSIIPVLIIVAIAVMFKWLDALLLQVAWNHGSIANPIYAFITIMVGFVLIMGLFKKQFTKTLLNRILLGAGAAAISVALFPLVKFTTGNPACLYAATNIPLVIYTAPVAIILSMITVPLGYRVALWYAEKTQGLLRGQSAGFMARYWSPAVVLTCLIIVTLARII